MTGVVFILLNPFNKKRIDKKDRAEIRSFYGFTLVELLAVIVIISVIALIITPMILNQIEQARKSGFIASAKNILDAANIYVSSDHIIPSDGIDVHKLEIKNKDSILGFVFQNSNEEFILKNLTDGSYCASGSKNDLIVRKGDCTGETDLYASLSLSIKEKTTRKITVVATASDDTGISGYSYCVADCGNEENWKSSEKNEYTFDSLRYSKKYEIHVRAINRIDKVTEKMIEVITENLPTASYSVTPSDWSKTKTATITYPNNVENYLIIHSGIAKLNGEVIPVGERRKISGTSAQVIFETNGTIEAITSDGYNEASPSTLTISQVDPTSPTSVSVGIGTVTSKSIQVIANGVDNESGIAKYEFQVNNGSWIDNETNNTYLFSNLTSGNYTYKVRLTNKAGGVTESSERVQATTTIVTPSYGVSPSGWAKSKTATITYQSGYTNQFRVLSGSATYNGTAVTNNTWITISGTSAGIVFNSNGTIEARSTDGINTVTSSTLTISQIDTTAPVVGSLSIASTNGSYNALTTTITSNVTDNSGASMQMHISNTGYETGGSWEAYSTSKSWNVGGSLNGGTRTIYITYMDQAGNKINRTLSYGVYAECSSNTNTSYGGWGACSKTCGGGTQTRSVTVTDRATARTCSSSTGSQACNTQDCCSSTTDYQWDAWGSCSASCGGGVQYRNVHRKSNYNGSYCGSYQQSQSCNTQSCGTFLINGSDLGISGGWSNYTYHSSSGGAWSLQANVETTSAGLHVYMHCTTSYGTGLLLVTNNKIDFSKYTKMIIQYKTDYYSGWQFGQYKYSATAGTYSRNPPTNTSTLISLQSYKTFYLATTQSTIQTAELDISNITSTTYGALNIKMSANVDEEGPETMDFTIIKIQLQ